MGPHGLYSPRNSPGQNTGVCSLSLLQGLFPTQESNQSLLHCRLILYQLSYHTLSLTKSPTFFVPPTFGRWLYLTFTEKRETNSDSFRLPFHQPMCTNSYEVVPETCIGIYPHATSQEPCFFPLRQHHQITFILPSPALSIMSQTSFKTSFILFPVVLQQLETILFFFKFPNNIPQKGQPSHYLLFPSSQSLPCILFCALFPPQNGPYLGHRG